MREIICEQGSAQWLEARLGKITASRIVDVMGKLKNGGENADRRGYRMELIAERLTRRTKNHFVTPAMAWGSEMEAFARAEYEIEQDVMVNTAGFVLHPHLDFAGASPDGLVGNDGGLEIKAPETTTYLKWLFDEGVVPAEHRPQMYWNMVCCERQWWDFQAYEPRLEDGLKKSFTRRLPRDEEICQQIEAEVIIFNGEVEQGVEFARRVLAETPSHRRSSLDELMAMAGELIP